MIRGANLRIDSTDLLRALSMAGGCLMKYATCTLSANRWLEIMIIAMKNMIGIPIPYIIAKNVMFKASEYLK